MFPGLAFIYAGKPYSPTHVWRGRPREGSCGADIPVRHFPSRGLLPEVTWPLNLLEQ
jgi:hypothetical protein